MNRLQTTLGIVAVALFGSTGLAHASMIDVTLGVTGSDFTFSSDGHTLVPNLKLAALGASLVLNSNSEIVSPPSTVIDQRIQPSGYLYGNNYLAIYGEPATGMATFTIGSALNVGPALNAFAFTWGTIDAYNTLKLTDSRNVTYTITGTDLLNVIANSVAGTTQADVKFIDPNGTFTMAQLISSDNAFEAANFSATDPPSGVPLPPALPLFAAALTGLALFTRRKAH